MKLGGGSMKEMGRSTKSIAIVIFTLILLLFLLSPLSNDFATSALAVILWGVIMWCLFWE